MNSSRSKGFTIVEILVVIGIIVVIAGLAYSAFGPAKKQATVTMTTNALRQTYDALELYRQQNDADGSQFGTSSQMGLPNREQFYYFWVKSGIKWYIPENFRDFGPVWYPLDPSDYIVPDQKAQWLAGWESYSAKEKNSSIILGDFNNTEGCGHLPFEVRCVFDGYGITLDGTLRHQSGAGDIHSYQWWEQ